MYKIKLVQENPKVGDIQGNLDLARSHIFIAQPPLYKVKKGKKDIYLKDEEALQEFLVDKAVDETELFATASKKIEAGKFKELLKLFNSFQSTIANPSVSLDQDILISMLNSDEFASSPSAENVKNG